MNLDKFFDNIEHTPSYLIKRNFNDLLRYKSKYKNLDQKNKDLLFDLVEKYIDKKKKYHRINSTTIRLEMNSLRKNMVKLDLTLDDLKDFEEILKEFTK
ncbi:MAG: hypothetical protein PF572_05585 [Patescibacteria group bacterium]|jgi:hypothetical protein|nr:hypothetical protein [Patescibacteria group bacterium]